MQSAVRRFVHPSVGEQESAVHGSLSLQSIDVPGAQVPSLQKSSIVQTSPSSHAPSVGVVEQSPVSGLHRSVVQGLESSHWISVPPVQVPLLHVSPVVQRFPSSQGAPSSMGENEVKLAALWQLSHGFDGLISPSA